MTEPTAAMDETCMYFLFDSVENAKHQIDSLASYLSNDSIRNIIESGFCIRMNFIEKYPFKYINYPL